MCQRLCTKQELMREHRNITAGISDSAMGGLLDKSLNEIVGRDCSKTGNRYRVFGFDTILIQSLAFSRSKAFKYLVGFVQGKSFICLSFLLIPWFQQGQLHRFSTHVQFNFNLYKLLLSRISYGEKICKRNKCGGIMVVPQTNSILLVKICFLAKVCIPSLSGLISAY